MASVHVKQANEKPSLAGSVPTRGDEEGPPQLLVPGHVSDLPRHVDKSPRHWGHSAEVEEPGRNQTMKKNCWEVKDVEGQRGITSTVPVFRN